MPPATVPQIAATRSTRPPAAAGPANTAPRGARRQPQPCDLMTHKPAPATRAIAPALPAARRPHMPSWRRRDPASWQEARCTGAPPMTDLARTDELFFTRTGMDRAPGRAHRRRGARRHGRRRAVPRIQPVGEPHLRRRPHQERLLRPEPGLRPARALRRGVRLCPCLANCPRTRSAAPARTVRAVQAGHERHPGRAAARHQPPALYRRQSAGRCRFRGQGQAPGRDRRLCARARTRACARSRPRSRACGRRCRSSAPDGSRVADIRPLVRLNVSIVVGDGDRMENGSLRRRRPRRLSALSRSRAVAAPRSTRRCARRWSISARCRRRPAR